MALIHKEVNDDAESHKSEAHNGPEYPMMSFFAWCFVFGDVGSCVIEDIIRDDRPHEKRQYEYVVGDTEKQQEFWEYVDGHDDVS
jgi:hypothetical protein